MKIGDLRGKWVFLQFGRTYDPESESTALVGSNIRESNGGYPFEFVQVFAEPTLSDGELFSFTQFAGIRAVPDPKLHPGLLSGLSFPEWFLIGPDGKVRASGGAMEPAALRKQIAKACAADPAMQGFPAPPTELQSMGEEMLRVYDEANLRPVKKIAESILGKDPASELALRFWLHSAINIDGYAKALKSFAERTDGMALSDPTRLYEAMDRLVTFDNAEARRALLGYIEKYPESAFLKAYKLGLQTLPRNITPADEYLLKSTLLQPHGWMVKYLLGFIAQASRDPKNALKYLRAQRTRKVPGRLALADQLWRMGRTEEARRLLAIRPDLRPENASNDELLDQMRSLVVLRDWKALPAYGEEYAKKRPAMLKGHLFQWLAALRNGDARAADAARKAALATVDSNSRFSVIRKWLESGQSPSAADLLEIPDANVRFDTAFLLALLAAEKSPGLPVEYAERLQLASLIGTWQYDLANCLAHVFLSERAAKTVSNPPP